MKCLSTLLLSALLLLPAVAGQQAPTNVSKDCGDAQLTVAPCSLSTGPDDPTGPHEQGIYVLSKGPDGSARLIKIESHRTELKVNYGKVFLVSLVSYGVIKTHLQAVLEGPQAEIATPEDTPVFYAYHMVGDLKLAKLTVKNGRREINVGESNAYSSHLGPDAKSVVESDVKVYFCDPHSPSHRATSENTDRLLRQYFPKKSDLSRYTQSELDKLEQLYPHIVKLTPLKPLPAGEYVFLLGKSTDPVFDFAVRPAR
jgi:hypothetical protein